jgi:hypothetical protein
MATDSSFALLISARAHRILIHAIVLPANGLFYPPRHGLAFSRLEHKLTLAFCYDIRILRSFEFPWNP